MLINADFSLTATVAGDQYRWVPSPQVGVERVMLDRVGAEKARATSIVRYAPNSYFPPHPHPGGEEILVLSGTFSEDGDHFPAGWYLRNPPGSSHRPSSADGAVLFVKLQQMHASETASVRIDTRDPGNWRRHGGREICPLFASEHEEASLQRLTPCENLMDQRIDAIEMLVLAGELVMDTCTYPQGSWLRFPVGTLTRIAAGQEGVTVYMKRTHPVRAESVA
ncbi:MAG TPA: cupin domain-containing protein [Luteibacter sp.]|jgi:anti-sigma factor ChrR (cupin superfamily)|uniref:cupin domain-containing protein n=1 Tax=Luteibacter sp. TaxID=1886636 RepID=UPI002F42DD0B